MSDKLSSDQSSRDGKTYSLGRNESELASSKEKIWAEDKLKRKGIAASLTNLVSGEEGPLVVSVNGHWGTGKTFLLQRWHQELDTQEFKAIYFNAWKDDFCDDPLVAIIGQLSNFLHREGFDFESIKSAFKPLLIRNALGVLSKTTGLVISEDDFETLADKTLEKYSEQAATKQELKKQLGEISQKIAGETGKPLIFIIDELDRCRPTFAIELLERVKHIFDIPNMVFVFGVNRKELCSSIESIYGKIDAEVYLRRFFDLEFSLPEASAEDFCKALVKKYQLKTRCSELIQDPFIFDKVLPEFYGRLGLSLRDMDDCVRSILFVAKNTEIKNYRYPSLIVVLILIALRLKNQSLYQKLMSEKCHANEVINYLDAEISSQEENEDFNYDFDVVEAGLYLFDRDRDLARKQLQQLSNQEADKDQLNLLSTRIKENRERVSKVWVHFPRKPDYAFFSSRHLYDLIELSSTTPEK